MLTLHHLDHGTGKFVDREGNLDAVDFGGIVQAAHMLARAENRGSGGGRVAADALEHRAAVAGDVRKHVDLRVVPVDEPPVVPDLPVGLIMREL